MLIILLTIAASLGALAGGYTAMRSSARLHLAMALTAGLVLGVVAFDLLPEVFDAAARSHLDTVWPMVLFAAGFLLFHTIEKFILVHQAAEEDYGPHRHPRLGMARAGALIGHSFFDGLSIGVGFQVSSAVGSAVALAVIGHRFADGFDTASFMLFNGNKLRHIRRLLWVVVIMPVLGGLASLLVDMSEGALACYLGFFAGVLMYIAASNILPQAHARKSSYQTMALTIAGAAFMFVVTRFV